jgi:hypothetical protein
VKRITQGENALVRRYLLKADGTPLLLADLTLLQADILQTGNIIETNTYPSAKLRQGVSTSQVELEVTTDISARFRKGRVAIKWTLQAPSLIFTAEDIQKDIITEDVFDVV